MCKHTRCNCDEQECACNMDTGVCSCTDAECYCDHDGEDRRWQMNLRLEMQKLWLAHVNRTYHFIISATTNQPDTQVVAAHLQENQDNIGNLIGEFYGADAGKALAKLLHEHIDIAANIVVASTKNNKMEADKQTKLWFRNADQMAEFLAKANPEFWPYDAGQKMLYSHLEATAKELEYRLKKDYKAAEQQSDEVIRQAIEMADMFSTGLIGKFG